MDGRMTGKQLQALLGDDVEQMFERVAEELKGSGTFSGYDDKRFSLGV